MRKLWRKLFPVRVEHDTRTIFEPISCGQWRGDFVIITGGGRVMLMRDTLSGVQIETIAHISPSR